MTRPRDDPPSNWADATRLTDDIYYRIPTDDRDPNPLIWHWCAERERWIAAGTTHHKLVSAEPLHLEPSLLIDCCGLHGYIRHGTWTSA